MYWYIFSPSFTKCLPQSENALHAEHTNPCYLNSKHTVLVPHTWGHWRHAGLKLRRSRTTSRHCCDIMLALRFGLRAALAHTGSCVGISQLSLREYLFSRSAIVKEDGKWAAHCQGTCYSGFGSFLKREKHSKKIFIEGDFLNRNNEFLDIDGLLKLAYLASSYICSLSAAVHS